MLKKLGVDYLDMGVIAEVKSDIEQALHELVLDDRTRIVVSAMQSP